MNLKEQLKSLKPGYAVRIHESDVAEAMRAHFSYSEDYKFEHWCKDNELIIFPELASDYIRFERKS